MATFVLVHGAFQGPWVWAETARELARAGHETYCPVLPGCGHLRGRLDAGAGLLEHIAGLTRYIKDEGLGEVILVANSYAGLVCCGVADALSQAVMRLVLVDGILPLPGRSFSDLGGEGFRQMLSRHALSVPGAAGGAAESLVRPWPLALFGVPAERADWFSSRLGPMALAAFTEPYPADGRVFAASRDFIRCTPAGNPMLAAMAARAESEGYGMHELASGHCAPACVPLELAALLLRLADQDGGARRGG